MNLVPSAEKKVSLINALRQQVKDGKASWKYQGDKYVLDGLSIASSTLNFKGYAISLNEKEEASIVDLIEDKLHAQSDVVVDILLETIKSQDDEEKRSQEDEEEIASPKEES